MKCGDARFTLAADPNDHDAALREHVAHCASCAAYAGDMQALDRRLRVALAVPVPAGRTTLRRDRHVTQHLALAASVAGVAILVGLLWTALPRESLASAAVDHMSHEPDAWLTTSELPGDEIERVVSESGVRLEPGRLQVTYARQCWFRGHFVPHLVVQTHDGPVTVLLLPAERVARRTAFHEGGYRGTLIPAGRGSIAVLARDDASIDEVADMSLAAVTFAR